MMPIGEDRQMPAQHAEAKKKRNDLGKHWFQIHGVGQPGKSSSGDGCERRRFLSTGSLAEIEEERRCETCGDEQ
jgi:hypothetical protein